MALGGFNDNNQAGPMADINVTPMVDVMLVLLVIFIITAPLFTHAIKLELPNAIPGRTRKTRNHYLSHQWRRQTFLEQFSNHT